MRDRLLDIGIVARRLEVTTQTIRNWIRCGRLPASRSITGRYKVRASALMALENAKNAKPIRSDESI